MPVITASALTEFSQNLLVAGGFAADDARQMARLLIWANLRGTDSHGVLRIPRYIEMLGQGSVSTGGAPEVVSDFGAVTVIDGGRCPGAVGMGLAVEKAAALASRLGVGICAARAISHAGAVGFFAESLARQGQVGIVMTASKPLMSYFGARGEALSTNPIAISAPVPGADPVTLDMSTAAVALGKVLAARDTGRALEPGWAIDETGAETTDANRVAALLPMAGAKGSGLSLMIEVLASVLAGNAVIAPVLLGRKKGGFNGLVIALDPAAFGPRGRFDTDMAELADAIHALVPAEGTPSVLLPGERGAATARKRLESGIPLAVGTARRLAEAAAELNVAMPPELAV